MGNWKKIYFVVWKGLVVGQHYNFEDAKKQCDQNEESEVWNEGKVIYYALQQ